MGILPDTDIQSTLERLFSWIRHKPSGISENEILDVEAKLGYRIPQALRTLYLLAGTEPLLMFSFNKFATLEQLAITDGLMIFAKENQDACFWAVNVEGEEHKVYCQYAESDEWIVEHTDFESFLAMLAYYQCTQMGYKYCGIIGLSGTQLFDILDSEWEKVVEYNGLHIYWQKGALIWSIEFSEEDDIENDIYFSTPFDELYYLNEVRFNLAEI